MIHGGPTGVWLETFGSGKHWGVLPTTVLAGHGYAVFRPNPRGSQGYGREFRFANRSDFGGGDFEDIMSGIDHLIVAGIADPDRLGIMGWSYGGYMSAWAITQTDRFKAASVGAGVCDLISMCGTCDVTDFIPNYFEGEIWEVQDLLIERSPVYQLGNVTTPTLILHGADDPRVPTSQGQELYTFLKRQGVPTEMVIYPRTGHTPREPNHQIDLARRNLEWFDHYLNASD